jgi:thiol:disulfide interchange protein DsbD
MKTGLLFLLMVHVVFCQEILFNRPSPFRWSGALSADSCGAGDSFSLRVRCAIDKEYFIYKSKTSLRFSPQPGIRFGAPVFSAVALHFDTLTGKNESVFVDSMIAVIPCFVSKETVGFIPMKVFISYQGCMNTMCFLPATDSLSFAPYVRPGSPVARAALSAASQSGDSFTVAKTASPQKDLSPHGIVALLLAFLGGLLTSLTPCVYPLIPVTIGIFGASAAKSRLRAFGLSCLYVAGIAVMFSSLGFVLAVTGKVFGQFMSNPWIIGFIAAVFGIFGVSLLGGFDIRLPSRLNNKLSSISGKSSGPFKVFFMGLIAGIIAAPCTGPSLGAILTYVATTGSQWFGAAMLFSFSLGLGFPFLILGTFSSLLASRPKPGTWMDAVKSALGIIMFVMALYFLRGAIPSMNRLFSATPLYYTLMAGSIALGIFMGAIHLSYHGASWKTAARKTTGCIMVTLGVFGIIGAALFGDHGYSETTGSEKQWLHDIDRGLQLNKEMKMPVIIDFYADWCIACKELDKVTFSDPNVQKELSRFIRVKADFTKDTPTAKQRAQSYAIRGLPVLEFYSTDGKRLSEKRVTGFVNAPTLLEHLKSIR